MRKHTIGYVKNYFKDHGCELLEEEYVGSNVKMKYRCKCGNINNIRFSDFAGGHRCRGCGNKKIGSKSRYLYKYVYNYFKDNECELLEKEYINAKTKMRYKCDCGNINNIRFSDFVRGNRCKECGIKKMKEKRKYPYEKVKKLFEENGCELLEKEYINCDVKMKYRCDCGNIREINFYNFKKGRRCRECGTKRMQEQRKHSLEYVKQFFDDGGCELLEKEYINSYTPMKYKCKCGNVSKISFGNFHTGRRCKKCSGTEKHTLEYVRNYFKDGGCELLENNYTKNDVLMKYRCNCGEVSKINFSNFKNGQRCRKCGIKKESGENNHSYNRNLSDEDRQDKRIYPEYIKWRKDVYERDDYTCRRCSQRGRHLNAHHIEGYAGNKELRADVDNGVTWCFGCHDEFHKIYGRKNNNREQYEEFIKMENFNYV